MSKRHQGCRSWVEALDGRRLLSGSLPGVPDVAGQFGALQSHAEGLAYELDEANGAPDASISNHYQGLVRYPGTGVPLFFVTQKHDAGGYLHVVTMNSRGQDGERLRSNLRVPNVSTEDATPPFNDTWLWSIRLNGNLTVDGQKVKGYIHPGGMAIVDNILFVAMDTPNTSYGQGGTGAIMLFDLGENGATKQNPKPIQVLPLTHMIDNLAVVNEGGNYLIWTNGNGGAETHVYRTNGAALRSNSLALRHVSKWAKGSQYDYSGPDWPKGASAHQSSTFIQQSTSATPGVNSPLYMVAMRHDGPFGLPLLGDDYADLYKVTPRSNGIKLTFVKSFHATLRYDEGGHLGNFAAAPSAYVSPSGELILYTAPHNDEDKFTVDNVRIGEIRHRDVVRPNSPLLKPRAAINGQFRVAEGGSVVLNGTAAPAVSPWVELFDDNNYGDRSVMIDYVDRAKFNLSNFDKLDGFGDKTTSVRWRLPAGMKVELFEDDNFRGSKKTLTGNGQVQQIADLGSFGDETSSLRFVGSNPHDVLTYTWDLDGDGVFGETGAAAARGNETGKTPTFVAGNTDGTATVPISLRVKDAAGLVATATGSVIVTNTPPTVSILGSSNGVPKTPMAFKLIGTDPSAADTAARFTYRVDYGDGTVVVYPPAARMPDASLIVSHTYTKLGKFKMVVTATDRDGAVSKFAVRTISIASTLPPTNARPTAASAAFSVRPLSESAWDLLDD